MIEIFPLTCGSDLQCYITGGGGGEVLIQQLMRIHYFTFSIVAVTALSVAGEVRARSLLQFSVSPSAVGSALFIGREEGGGAVLVFVPLYSTQTEEIFRISYTMLDVLQPDS